MPRTASPQLPGGSVPLGNDLLMAQGGDQVVWNPNQSPPDLPPETPVLFTTAPATGFQGAAASGDFNSFANDYWAAVNNYGYGNFGYDANSNIIPFASSDPSIEVTGASPGVFQGGTTDIGSSGGVSPNYSSEGDPGPTGNDPNTVPSTNPSDPNFEATGGTFGDTEFQAAVQNYWAAVNDYGYGNFGYDKNSDIVPYGDAPAGGGASSGWDIAGNTSRGGDIGVSAAQANRSFWQSQNPSATSNSFGGTAGTAAGASSWGSGFNAGSDPGALGGQLDPTQASHGNQSYNVGTDVGQAGLTGAGMASPDARDFGEDRPGLNYGGGAPPIDVLVANGMRAPTAAEQVPGSAAASSYWGGIMGKIQASPELQKTIYGGLLPTFVGGGPNVTLGPFKLGHVTV